MGGPKKAKNMLTLYLNGPQLVGLKDFSVLFYECSNLCHGVTWLQYARQAQLIYDRSFLFDLQKNDFNRVNVVGWKQVKYV